MGRILCIPCHKHTALHCFIPYFNRAMLHMRAINRETPAAMGFIDSTSWPVVSYPYTAWGKVVDDGRLHARFFKEMIRRVYLALVFLMLFFISAALAWLLKYKFEQALAIACLAMIAILYLAGLAEALLAGVYVIVLASIAALGLFVFVCARRGGKGLLKKDYLLNHIFTPGFFVFCIFYIFICFVHRGRMLTLWDEFVHWGLVVKNMSFFNAFGNHPEATTVFRGYPPATALFQYFWAKICGYSEPNLFRSMNVLCFALVLPVFKNLGWKKRKLVPVIAVMIFLIPVCLYSNYYQEIFVDAVLGILFAYILFAYFTEKSFNAAFFINLALALFVLTLVKASGFGLALIAALIITLDQIIGSRKSRRTTRQTRSEAPVKYRLRSLLVSKPLSILAAAWFVPVIANYSWAVYRRFTSTGFAWTWNGAGDLSLSAIAGLLKGNASSYQYQTIENFILSFFTGSVFKDHVGLSYFQWALLIAVIVLFIWRSKGKDAFRNRLPRCTLGVFAGWAIYTASLAVLYMFTFHESEAIRLASYNRYMNTYLLAVICLFCSLFVYYAVDNQKLEESTRPVTKMILVLMAFLLFFNVNAIPDAIRLVAQPSIRPGRAAVTISRISSLPLDYQTDTIYYICQNTLGHEHNIARYEITPIKINGEAWSIGQPYSDGDGSTISISCSEWLAVLKTDYTYVYLESVDEQFIAQFGEAFEHIEQIQNHALYRVEASNGRVILTYVEI